MDLFPSKTTCHTWWQWPRTHGANVSSIDDRWPRHAGVIAITQFRMPDTSFPEAVAVTARRSAGQEGEECAQDQVERRADGPDVRRQIDDLLNGLIDKVKRPDTGDGMVDAVPVAVSPPRAMGRTTGVAEVRVRRAEIWAGNKIPIIAQRISPRPRH